MGPTRCRLVVPFSESLLEQPEELLSRWPEVEARR